MGNDKKNIKGKQRTNKGRTRTSRGSAVNSNNNHLAPTNDPTWYMNDPLLASTVANLNFGTRLGQTFKILDHEAGEFKFKAPGIMTIFMNPCIGYTEDATDPTNVAARRMYSALTHGSGRTASYTPADITQVTLAYAEIVKLIKFAIRVMQSPFMINPLSKYEPDMVVRASGIDYDDLRANLHAYIGNLQSTIARANRIQMPADLTMFKKAWAEFENIYTDTPDAMSQLYVTIPSTTWVYTEYEDKAPELVFTEIFAALSQEQGGLTQITMGSLLERINNMIDVLYSSEACLAIMADILHVIINKGGSAFTIPQVSVDLITAGPAKVFSEEFNLQLLNATIAYPWDDENTTGYRLDNFSVKQDASKAIVTSRPRFSAVVPAYEMSRLLISRLGPLNPEGVIVATRYMVQATEHTINNQYDRFVTEGRVYVGDTFISGIIMWTDPEEGGIIAHIDPVLVVPLSDSITSDTVVEFMAKLSAFNNFNNAPLQALFSVSGEDANIKFNGHGYFTDLSYYTTISPEQLIKVHDACMLSFFDFNYGVKR